MLKFTHIRSIYNVVKYLRTRDDHVLPRVKYRGTVKLHGTHAAVECSTEQIRPLSRERYISIQSDNAGFAAFVAGDRQQESIRKIESDIRTRFSLSNDVPVMLYGEWCGPGIQKGVAINKLPERQFVIFAAGVPSDDAVRYIDAISRFEGIHAAASIYSIFDAPTWELEVDFSDELALEQSVAKADEITLLVEEKCPYASLFGIEGVGEGIVWTPVNVHFGWAELFWKSKGPKHREVASKMSGPRFSAEQLTSVNAFVDFALTDVRLSKGIDHVRALGLPIDMKSTGTFLKWLADDITRECADELSENNLEWKFAAKLVNTRAIRFWKKQVELADS